MALGAAGLGPCSGSEPNRDRLGSVHQCDRLAFGSAGSSSKRLCDGARVFVMLGLSPRSGAADLSPPEFGLSHLGTICAFCRHSVLQANVVYYVVPPLAVIVVALSCTRIEGVPFLIVHRHAVVSPSTGTSPTRKRTCR